MKPTDKSVIVAADGGGTGCRAAVGTLANGVMAQATGGPGNVQNDFDAALTNLTGTVAEALAHAGLSDIPLDHITAHFGVAGAHSRPEMAAIERALPYGACSVTGDRDTSVRGVLGESDGYVVALGTGTIIARQRNLALRTMGGWGFDLSDQASGAWLGHRLLQETALAHDGFRPHTPLTKQTLDEHGGLVPMIHFANAAGPFDLAKFARSVIETAKVGDPVGQELMHQGAAFVVQALDALGFQDGAPLVLTAGVGPHYRDYLPARYTGNLVASQGTALDGAFAMACAAARTAQDKSQV